MANFVVRTGDTLSTGHGCTGTTTLAGDNQDGTVHANGIDIAVIGAPTVSHAISTGPTLCSSCVTIKCWVGNGVD